MKVHLIASAYFHQDADPCLIVSMKKYDQLMKDGFSGELEFYGAGETAEAAHSNIYGAWGLEYKKKDPK